MDEKSLGRVYYTSGHVYEILSCRKVQFAIPYLQFETELGEYIRIRDDDGYKFYKTRINKDWERVYVRVNDIDRIEFN